MTEHQVSAQAQDRPQAVIAVRYLVRNLEGQILLVQRSNNLKWEAPGGKVEKGQTIEEAEERELLEEANIIVLPSSPFSSTSSRIIHDGKYAGMLYLSHTRLGNFGGGKIRLSSEHDNHRWVAPQEALELNLTYECRKAIAVWWSQLA